MPGPTATTPAAWYKADALGLADGATVSTWTDSSGNGRTATHNVGGSPDPIYKAGIARGMPVVRFGGDYFTTTIPALGTDFTVFVVTSGGGNRIFGDSGYRVGQMVSGINQAFAGTDQGWTMPTLAGEFAQMTYVANGAASIWRRGGVPSVDGARDPGSNGMSANPTFGDASPGQPWGGDLAEFIVYDEVLTDSERGEVEAYLHQKYFAPSPPIRTVRPSMARA